MVAANDFGKNVIMEDKLSECKNRTYLYGLATGSITFAGCYFLQSYLAKRWRNSNKAYVLGTTTLAAGLATYLVVKDKLKECESSARLQRVDALAQFKTK